MMDEITRVAAIGDLHVQEEGSVSYREIFAEMSEVADVIAITGDLTDLGKPAEARLLVEELRGSRVPIVAVLGNHDHQCGCVEEVSSIIREAGVYLLDGTAVELKGVTFAGVKGFVGGFGRHMLASFGEAAIKAMVAESLNEAIKLENALRQIRTPRSLAVLHYAPTADTVVGEPEQIWPFLGSARLGETIDRYRVSAVVHGHAHHGTHEGRTAGGIPVYNVARHIEKPQGKPYIILEL